MNIQNDLKVFHITSSVNAFENQKTKIFCGFLVFDYPLWRKTKARKRRKSTESLLNKKKALLTAIITRQLLKQNEFVI